MSSNDRSLQTAAWVARALDDWYLDPIIGFVLPGLGDLLGSLLGLYLVVVGVQRRVSRLVIARMLINLAVDSLVGALPIVGDLFDVAWKANRRNLALLQQREPNTTAHASDWLFVGGAALCFLTAVAAPVVVFVMFLRLLMEHA